jgi:Domain of unknown function (DUF4281)
VREGWPTPDQVFRIANMLALLGWLSLGTGVVLRWHRLRTLLAGRAVPLLLSTGYVAILGAHWSESSGSFSSLAGVANLFQSPWMLLAGWVHYLAFDLFVGTWIAADADAIGAPRSVLIIVLPAVFLFGPAGFLLWFLLKASLFSTLLKRTVEERISP